MRPSRTTALATGLGTVLLLVASILLPTALASPAQAAPASRASECTAAQLTGSYADRDAAASHRYGALRLTNTSATSCWIRGYGGLSLVGHGNGTQVGRAATRTPSRVRRVWLTPGQAAVTRVSQSTTGPYSAKRCRPTQADGFRVYPPDSTASIFVPHPTKTCANQKLSMLSHKAYRRAAR